MRHRLIAVAIASVLICGGVELMAQTQARPQEPFKLGTFERQGRVFLGMVLRDTQIVDIAAANAAYESRDSTAPKLTIPGDMKNLIERYKTEVSNVSGRAEALSGTVRFGWDDRLRKIANETASASSAPQYVYRVNDVKVLPPVRPAVMLNAAVNYQAHGAGIEQQRARVGEPARTPTASSNTAPGIWERKPGDERWNPYLFVKMPTAIIANGEPIRAPAGRERIDHECELGVVVGKTAKHVPLTSAADYVFGYTIQNDVSDRGGRGDSRFGSDWLIGKNHDTFAPLGPYIVPKEFVKDPMNLRQVLTLNGETKQDSNTQQMIHSAYDLLHYGSNILTLQPGDVIAGGSPAGTNIERPDPRWMRPGDTVVCTIEGIGTLTNPVIADSH